MHLYNFTIQKPTAVVDAIYGNFSSTKAQEFIVARGKVLELMRPSESGKLISVLTWECFGIIRSIKTFRLPGSTRDYILVGSDSGRMNILQYDDTKNRFVKIHEETFGRTGCRRQVPGQYLASDPRGRACMIAALEKQKFVYVLNRTSDQEMNLTISSPLEAHKAHTLCFSLCGVDVGFENPIFAAIEVDYEDADQPPKDDEVEDQKGDAAPVMPPKMLTFYELDLGLNHMVRKWSEPVDPSSNLVITVPGDTDGPGGVLVCSEDAVTWRQPDQPEVRVALPRRTGLAEDRGQLITSYAVFNQKKNFFFLIQSEFGDIFKLTLVYDAGGAVTDMRCKYLDSCPPATALCLTRSGLLYTASEFGAQYFFQIQGLGDDDDTAETCASVPLDAPLYFDPRPLKNLALLDELDSLAPLLDVKAADLCQDDTMQIFAACGRGARSSLKILRQGLQVSEQAVTQLATQPTAVWSVKRHRSDPFDSYIVVSFINSTIVLSIGETVEEVSDSGFIDQTQTLHCALLGDDSLLQVHPDGIRHIRADRRVNEWKPSGKKKVLRAASNERQVIVALTGGDLMYFDLDRAGQLLEIERRDLGNDCVALALPPLPRGSLRSKFAAVGLYDNTVRILSLDAGSSEPLRQVTLQACAAQPHSLLMQTMNTSGSSETEDLFLFTGLQNGVLMRSLVDTVEGKLTDTRKRFLGTQPIKLFPLVVRGRNAVMSLSSRSWLSYTLQGQHMTTPLSYEPLGYASHFASEQVPEGVVSVSGDLLRIFMMDRLGESFNQTSIPLRYTPRKLLVDSEHRKLVVVESDHNAYSAEELRAIRKELSQIDENGDVKPEESDDMSASAASASSSSADESPEEAAAREAQEAFMGPLQGGSGKWASCIRIVDPVTTSTTHVVELTDNEAAFSASLVKFSNTGDELFLAVGTAKDLTLTPRHCTQGSIHIYRFAVDGSSMELVHKTQTEDVVLALNSFHGQLLAGIGKVVRLYELGKKKLLRKSELKSFPTAVQSLHSMGDRIFGGDMSEAFQFMKYRRSDRSMYVFAENSSPRFLTATCVVDYDTMAGGDKFGNLLVSRLPEDFAEDVEDTSAASVNSTVFNSNTNKLTDVANFYVGEAITSITKTALMPGGAEVLLYSTLYGTIGALVPFTSREDVEFFTHLEMHMRQHSPSLVGRDHLSFRSYYFPVKGIVDGDLCEQYSSIEFTKQKTIAQDLVRAPNEVAKRLEEIRNRVL